MIERFLKAYGDRMEFCQIQLNYLDWTFQDAKAKIALLDGYGIPVWVMEPLRGGRLASLSPEDAAKLKTLRPGEGVPAWAFRFLQSLPSVTVVLSGMSSFAQLEENLGTFEAEKPLDARETETPARGRGRHVRKIALPCTACRYCTSHCPQGLDIPSLLAALQRALLHGGRVPRADGPVRAARGQTPARLPRLPQLRGGLPPADQDFRGHGGFHGEAERVTVRAPASRRDDSPVLAAPSGVGRGSDLLDGKTGAPQRGVPWLSLSSGGGRPARPRKNPARIQVQRVPRHHLRRRAVQELQQVEGNP